MSKNVFPVSKIKQFAQMCVLWLYQQSIKNVSILKVHFNVISVKYFSLDISFHSITIESITHDLDATLSHPNITRTVSMSSRPRVATEKPDVFLATLSIAWLKIPQNKERKNKIKPWKMFIVYGYRSKASSFMQNWFEAQTDFYYFAK